MSITLEELAINYLEQLVGLIQQAATQQQLDQIQSNQVIIVNELNSMASALNTNFPVLLEGINRIILAVNNLATQGQQPLQLPPTAPPGWNLGDDTIYNQVWLPPDSFGQPPIGYLFNAGWFATNLGELRRGLFPNNFNAFFLSRRFWDSPINNTNNDFNLSLFDTTDLFAHGSLLGWLNFHKGTTFSVAPDFDPGRYEITDLTYSGGVDNTLVTSITESEWLVMSKSAAAAGAPIWPGIANVTLGTSVALVDGLTVTGPLDGLIITISAVAPPIGFYPFGTRKSFVHAGAVIFIDDNGEAEHSQAIGLDDQVLTPMTMVQATSAILRVKSGVTGTVQPWVVT